MNVSVQEGFNVMGETFRGSFKAILVLLGVFILAYLMFKHGWIK